MAKTEKELQLELEAARQKLTDEQRAHLERFSDGLKESGTYQIEYELRAAKVIRTETGHHLRSELRGIDQDAQARAQQEQREAFIDADKQNELKAQQAEQAKKQQLEAQAREQKARETQELGKQQAAPQEVASWDAWKARIERNEPGANGQKASNAGGAHDAQGRLIGRSEQQQEVDAPEKTAGVNAPGRRSPEIGRYDELKRLSEQGTPLSAQWRVAAQEVCDPKKPPGSDPQREPPNSPGSDGPDTSPPRTPNTGALPVPPRPVTQALGHDPTPPPSSTNANQPLNANEVLQRFGNSALEARYQQNEQQRQEEGAKSALWSADPTTRSTAPARDGSRDTALMAAFVRPEIKQQVQEEQAARVNDPSRTQGRGR